GDLQSANLAQHIQRIPGIRSIAGDRPRNHFTLASQSGVIYPGAATNRSLRADVAQHLQQDRKSTRLNSSHVKISYAVLCLNTKREASHREGLEEEGERDSATGQEKPRICVHEDRAIFQLD